MLDGEGAAFLKYFLDSRVDKQMTTGLLTELTKLFLKQTDDNRPFDRTCQAFVKE